MKADFVPISKMLGEGQFVIPKYQRAFDWKKKDVAALWGDAVNRETAGHFIGAVLVHRYGNKKFFLVDGQQRLTTIAMGLCAVRDRLAAEGLAAEADELHEAHIRVKEVFEVADYRLKAGSDTGFFCLRIQQRNPDTSLKPAGARQENLLRAALQLRALVDAKCDATDPVPTPE
ncbi:MAG: DUF262 domain-containing protein, partial [Sandaracinaceae bacterium]